MVLGTANKYSLYIVKATNEPPNAEGDYTNYTSNLLQIRIKQGINKLDYFEAKLIGIKSAAQRADIAKDNFAYIFSSTTLISKFKIEEPEYDSVGYSVSIKGYESTGSANLPRQLINEVTPRQAYENYEMGNLVSSFSKDANNACLIKVDATDTGGPDIITFNGDYTNKIKALTDAANSTRKEWWIEHQCVTGTGDILHVADMKGTTTPPYTFYTLTSSKNAKLSKYNEDTQAIANRVITAGQDIHSVQQESEIYDATITRSYLSCAVDGWLNADINAESSQMYLTSSDNQITNGIHCFRIDSEIICGCISGTYIYDANRGFNDSPAMCHKKGSDVVSDNGFAELWVQDSTQFSVNDCVRVGSETFEVTSLSGACLQATRVDDTCNWYAHDICAPVYLYKRGGTTYDPDTPASNSNSINCYGVKSCKTSTNGVVRRHDLDMIGYGILEAKKGPIKKITILPAKPHEVITAIEPGDYTCICAADTSINLSNMRGRIIGWDLSYDRGRDNLDVYISDTTYKGYDLDPRQDFVGQERERTKNEQQEPTRQFQTDRTTVEDKDMEIKKRLHTRSIIPARCDTYDLGSSDKPWEDVFVADRIMFAGPTTHYINFNGTGTHSLCIQSGGGADGAIIDFSGCCVCGVATPTDLYDAANKKYVDDTAGPTAGKWTDGDADWIVPLNNCCACAPQFCSTGDIFVANDLCICGDTYITDDLCVCDIICSNNTICAPIICGTLVMGGCVCSSGSFINAVGDLRAGNEIYVNYGGVAGNRSIYWFDDGSPTGQELAWIYSPGYFCFSDDLRVTGYLCTGSDITSGGSVIATDNLMACGRYIYMNCDGGDNDQIIYFYEGGSDTGAYLKWCDASSCFVFSHPISGATGCWESGSGSYICPKSGCYVCAICQVINVSCSYVGNNSCLCASRKFRLPVGCNCY